MTQKPANPAKPQRARNIWVLQLRAAMALEAQSRFRRPVEFLLQHPPRDVAHYVRGGTQTALSTVRIGTQGEVGVIHVTMREAPHEGHNEWDGVDCRGSHCAVIISEESVQCGGRRNSLPFS